MPLIKIFKKLKKKFFIEVYRRHILEKSSQVQSGVFAIFVIIIINNFK